MSAVANAAAENAKNAETPVSPGPPEADEADEASEAGEAGEAGDVDVLKEESEKPTRKAIKDEKTGYLMIQEEDGTISRPTEVPLPATWKQAWGSVDMQKAEIRLAEFKNAGKEKNPNRALPHGKDLCACIGVSEEDEEEAGRCEALYLEMRKDWKKQFPKSTKHNDVPFDEYEAMVLADLYEEAYEKFLIQAELHDEGHKPDNRLKHYKAYSEKRRSKYNEMKKTRLERDEETRKKRKEAAQQRARDAPAKKADATAKLLADGIAAHKKTDQYKTEQKDNQSRIRDLLKKYMAGGMDMDEALDKATDEVLG